MHNRDYYDVLGLAQDSSPSRIKKKYYNLALKWHPDKHNNKREANHRFNEISEAYSILIDPKRKEVYDKYGHDGLRRLENNQSPNQDHGINTFLKKGFCGTDKSAFEFLWDILKEESQDPNGGGEEAFNPYDNYTGEPSETFGFDFENFVSENNDGEIFELFEPSSFDNSELLNPFFMTFEIQQENPNSAEENKNVFFDAPERQNPDAYYVMGSPTRDDLDSDEFSVGSLANKLNEFQSSLNHFHRKLEDNINSRECLSPNSKKISKPEKFTPSYFQKRNHLYNPMQSTFIN